MLFRATRLPQRPKNTGLHPLSQLPCFQLLKKNSSAWGRDFFSLLPYIILYEREILFLVAGNSEQVTFVLETPVRQTKSRT